MIPLNIFPDASVHFDLDPERPQIHEASLTSLGMLRHGTKGGRAVVVVVTTLPDGTQVVAQTTWALFNTAAKALAHTPIASEET